MRAIDSLVVEAQGVLSSGRELYVSIRGEWVAATDVKLLEDNTELVIVTRAGDGFVLLCREDDIRGVMAPG
jgi:hypothetical protein